jgi:hypothetical protein
MSEDRKVIAFIRRTVVDKPDVSTAHREIMIPAINLMLERGYTMNEIIDILRHAADALAAKGA